MYACEAYSTLGKYQEAVEAIKDEVEEMTLNAINVSNFTKENEISSQVMQAVNKAAALACDDHADEALEVLDECLSSSGFALESSDPDPKNVLPTALILIYVYIFMKKSKKLLLIMYRRNGESDAAA